MFYAVLTLNSTLREVCKNISLIALKEILKGSGRNPLEGKKKGSAKLFAKMNLAEGVPNFICIRSAVKEAEDFSTMVMVAAINLCSYVSLERFLMNTEACLGFKDIYRYHQHILGHCKLLVMFFNKI